MRFREIGVEFERLQRCSPHQALGLADRHPLIRRKRHVSVSVGDPCVRRRELRSHRDDLLEIFNGFLHAGTTATHECSCREVTAVRVRTEIVDAPADRTLHSKPSDDILGDLIADGEHVTHISVEALVPERHACGCLQELRIDVNVVSRTPNRAVEHESDVEPRGHVSQILSIVLEGKTRRARADLQMRIRGKAIDDFFCEPIGEFFTACLST